MTYDAAQDAVTGVILAGGESRRMGQNKALMRLGGARLIDRVVGVMRQVCPRLLMVTNSPEVYAEQSNKTVTIDVGAGFAAMLETMDRDRAIVDITPTALRLHARDDGVGAKDGNAIPGGSLICHTHTTDNPQNSPDKSEDDS